MSPEDGGHFRATGRPRIGGRFQPVKLTGHLNSVGVETLLENLHRIESVEDIRDFFLDSQPESVELFDSIVNSGAASPRQALYEFALREAEIAIETRRLLLADVDSSSCAIFLPLPPHVIDIIRDRVSDLPCFNTEERRPNHLRELPQQALRGGIFANAFSELRDTRSIVIDGQLDKGALYIRTTVAPLISSMVDHALERVYFHRIPHLPPGQEFADVHVDTSRIDIRYV